ncbi:MAG: GNAT family N-acetyltransferase [Acholeplasmataceae bacterium]
MDTLVTRRLILRQLEKTDAEAMFQYAQKTNIGPMAGWRPHQNIDETKAIINMMINENEVWAITIKPNDVLVGTIGLHTKDFHQALEFKKELGFVLDEPYWGQGYVLEAVEAILKYAFRTIKLDVVSCVHYSSNKQSRRVIEKAGFEKIHAEMRDDAYKIKRISYYYEIKRRDYIGGKHGKIKFEI